MKHRTLLKDNLSLEVFYIHGEPYEKLNLKIFKHFDKFMLAKNKDDFFGYIQSIILNNVITPVSENLLKKIKKGAILVVSSDVTFFAKVL